MRDGDSLECEVVMMEELNTGRGSLREAFRILELSGVLEVRTGPNGGPIVRDPDISHYAGMWSLFLRMNGGTYRELMEANMVVEPPIAAIGAARRDPERIAALRAAVELEASIPEHDGRAYMAANAAFHDAVAWLGSNRALYLYLRGNHWITSILFGNIVAVGEVQGEVHAAHRSVLKAVTEGNGKRAEAVLRQHLELSMEYCERKFGALLDETVRWH